MTTRVALVRTNTRVRRLVKKAQKIDGWALIRGLWKGRNVDPVEYQRRIRKEADRTHV